MCNLERIKQKQTETCIDRLYQEAYEKGRRDATRVGRWIPVHSFEACGGDETAWLAQGDPIVFYYCSECKEHAYAGEDGESLLTDWCPNCGARMSGNTTTV